MKKLVTLLAVTGLVFVAACGGGEDAGMDETDQMEPSSEMMEGDTMQQDTMMEEGMPDEMMEEDGGMSDDEGGMSDEDEMGGDGMGGGA